MNTNTNPHNMLTTYHGTYPTFSGPILPEWVLMANAKGFDLVDRIIDRLHLALRCRHCGALNRVKLFTMRSAQPLCHACVEAEWRAEAAEAGLTLLRRDPADRHYGVYRAPCGHEVRRQFALIKRIAAGEASGETGIRCETCHTDNDAAVAKAQGWILLGPDSEGNSNYRRYRHIDCGHEQRIARINMQTGRFSCGNCGKDWTAAPSFIYAMSFIVASGREVIKLGFSRDPESRLAWQLKRDPEMPCELLATVPMESGHAALRAEKALHRRLRSLYPDAVLAPSTWRHQIRVKSEIYDATMRPVIMGMLDETREQQRAA